MTDTHSIGIDVGSTTVKLVGVDSAGSMLWHKLEQDGSKNRRTGNALIETESGGKSLFRRRPDHSQRATGGDW